MEHVFSSTSKLRILWLGRQIHLTQKNTIMVDHYLGKINEIVDTLALSSVEISYEDVILITLEGLDPKPDYLVTCI